MPALSSFEAGFACTPALEALGFRARGEYGIPRRHYFTRQAGEGADELQAHVHAYATGEGQWDDQLVFRDYLRAHPDARDDYVRLKRKLARRFGTNPNAYAEAKSDFISEILRSLAGRHQ